MSGLSKIKNEFLSFVESLAAKLTPEAQAEVAVAAAPVHQAISDAEGAVVSEVETAALPTLAAVASKAAPPELAPLVPLIFNLGVAALTSKASTSTPA